MKCSHIIAIVIIAVSIGALVGSLYDSSTYADATRPWRIRARSTMWWALWTGPKRSCTNPA
ncbi:MAG: hypothetical protein IPF64_12490 [Flavobacteriales bacterium]|nr:hypothetical protein [Flavobacteriales bacterium]